LDSVIYDLTEEVPLPRQAPSSLDVVVDRLMVKSGITRRLADSLETALRYGHDVVKILIGEDDERLFTQRLVCPACGFAYPDLTPAFFSPNSPDGACPACDGLGVQQAKKQIKKTKTSSSTEPKKVGRAHSTAGGGGSPTETLICSVCEGTRLTKESRGVRIHGCDITQVFRLSISAAHDFCCALSFTGQQGHIARPLCQEIIARLRFLLDVGLDYLTLDRPTVTLSGGESQRIRLATQIGAGLSGVLYVLDEPSIGLHPRDTSRLLSALQQLRDWGNSVIVVEHDRETILAADYVIDLGPGAGERGGELLAAGTPQEVMAAPASLTGKYLRGELAIPVPPCRRTPQQWLTVSGVSLHNLKNVTAAFPLGTLTCVTGVSGSGKSSLIMGALAPALSCVLTGNRKASDIPGQISGWQRIDKVIQVDQAPISRIAHSNPATYVGLLNPIRELFAQLPEARVRGYGPERFSFNVKGGRCEACEGDGVVTVEMYFLPDMYVVCEVCRGARYNRETLEVQFRGKNIAQVLDLTVNEALEFLGDLPTIRPRLETLRDVGLAYLRLGQPAPTLSGGEAQRLKLAKELSRKASGHTVYILDEPTTGLHFADIQRLLQVLNLLVEAGHTVLVIEHNLDVIKTADFVIDLGPEGGEQGGEIVAAGTPEEVAHIERSHTGRLLRPALNPSDSPAVRQSDSLTAQRS
jgi:excinuclease ABC subunit A